MKSFLKSMALNTAPTVVKVATVTALTASVATAGVVAYNSGVFAGTDIAKEPAAVVENYEDSNSDTDTVASDSQNDSENKSSDKKQETHNTDSNSNLTADTTNEKTTLSVVVGDEVVEGVDVL